MPLRTDKEFILAKLESTAGSIETLAGSDAINNIVSITPIQLIQDRKERTLVRNHAGSFPTVPTNQHAQISFTCELVASGVQGTAPDVDILLKSCGLTRADTSTTNTYTPDPVLATADTITIAYYLEGNCHRLFGCRGTFEISMQTSEVIQITFTFKGKYQQPFHDSSAPTPSYSQKSPVVANATNTTPIQVHSYQGAIKDFTFNLENEYEYYELMGGTKEVRINSRKSVGSITMESPSFNDKNYFSIAEGSSTGNVTWQNGQSNGAKITFLASYAEIEAPTLADSDGYSETSFGFRALPSSGNDEFSLLFH